MWDWSELFIKCIHSKSLNTTTQNPTCGWNSSLPALKDPWVGAIASYQCVVSCLIETGETALYYCEIHQNSTNSVVRLLLCSRMHSADIHAFTGNPITLCESMKTGEGQRGILPPHRRPTQAALVSLSEDWLKYRHTQRHIWRAHTHQEINTHTHFLSSSSSCLEDVLCVCVCVHFPILAQSRKSIC